MDIKRAGGITLFLISLLTGCFVISLYGSSDAHAENIGHMRPMGPMTSKRTAIGFNEKLGSSVPLDLTFKDENGKDVKLGEFINKPTILSLVYYSCPNVCNTLLGGMAAMLSRLDVPPGDYRVLTISFDPTDTTSTVEEKKRNFYNTLGHGYPERTWRFLTGDQKNIDRLTGAVGFGYVRSGEEFEHPVGLIILARDSKITRYIYGASFLPFEVKMALIEASHGRIGPTVNRLLDFCYSYNSASNRYVFNVLKVTVAVSLLTVFLFAAYIVVTNKKYRKGDRVGK